jgi:hypothetical protein
LSQDYAGLRVTLEPLFSAGGFKGSTQFLGEFKRLVSTGEVAKWEDHA